MKFGEGTSYLSQILYLLFMLPYMIWYNIFCMCKVHMHFLQQPYKGKYYYLMLQMRGHGLPGSPTLKVVAMLGAAAQKQLLLHPATLSRGLSFSSPRKDPV